MSENLHTLSTNAKITEYRKAKFEGREHIVAPVVILVEGVHNGSSGALLYGKEELQKSAHFWNGVPLPVGHPELNGGPISCNSPSVVESRSVGRLWNVKYEDAPSALLRGEAWIDVQKAQQISPAILERMEKKEPLEVSTGLFSRDEAVPGTWNNESYQAVVHDIRPDHLALLPSAVGACSLKDGCGIRFNQKLQTNKGDNMDRKQKVDQLIANKAFIEEDRTMLEGLEDAAFGRIEALHANAFPPNSGKGKACDDSEDMKDGGKDEDKEKNKDQKQNQASLPSFEDLLKAAPPEVQAQHAYMTQKFNEHREGLVGKIKANKANKITDAQLGMMDIQTLEAISNSFVAPTANYDGNGGNHQTNNQKYEPPALDLPCLCEKK